MIKSKKYQVAASVSGDRCVMKVQKHTVLQRFFKTFSAITLFLLLLVGAPVEGAGQTTQTFTTSGSWTVPSGVTSVQVECWGAGGGGGGNNSTSDGAGGGGGGGYSRATLTVIPGNIYTINVGNGGTGGTGAQNGSSGESSWFGSITTILANGGSGGEQRTNNGGDGGTGAAIGVVTGTNTARFTGGNGAAGRDNNTGIGGGGGSSAGTSANGNNASSDIAVYSQTGASAPTGGGAGADGDGDGGSDGASPGGGGAGAGDKDNNFSTANSGGKGGNGLVRITYTMTTPPDCISLGTPANSAVGFPVSSNLSWSSVPGASGYRIYLGTDALATNILNGIDLGNVTSYNPTSDLSFLTTYYWKIVPYNNFGPATGCTIWEFTTEDFSYCSASSTIPAQYETITNVTFAGINNSSPVNKTIGYIDYTNTVNPAIIAPGQNYSISVTETFQSGSYPGYCKVYIDYNHNGTFETPGELTFGFAYNGNATMTGTITVPISATIGTTRMRVVLEGDANSSGALPCGTFQWGEVEDYTINILQPCSNATLNLNTGNNIQSVCENSSITNILYTIGGSATGATVSGLPLGINGTFNNGTINISGTPTEIGIFNYTVTTTGTPTGCDEATASGTITVNPLPTANISGDNGPLCAGDNAVFNLTGTAGAVVTYKVNSGSEQTIALTGGVATISINNVNDDQVLTLVSITNGTCGQNLNTTSTITVNPLPEIGSFN